MALLEKIIDRHGVHESSEPDLPRSVAKMLQTYYEINADSVDEFTQEPTPLEFMKYVHRNRPFIVRGGCADWPAVRKWNLDYLLQKVGASTVEIAETPRG